MRSYPQVVIMLKEYPVTVERNLEWGDMDAYSHVNNIIYFRFFENARTTYFMKIKIAEEMRETGVGPILKSTSCIFRIPLTFPDTIIVGTKVTKIDVDRFTMTYAVFSKNHQRIAAEGEGVVVSLNYRTGEKTPLSKTVVAAIHHLEGPNSLLINPNK